MSLYAQYGALLDGVLDGLVAEGALPAGLDRKNVAVEPPRDSAHGDLATNAAMVLAKAAATNPRALAGLIAPKLEALPGVTAVEIAGPGFINLRLDEAAWRDELGTILGEARRTAGRTLVEASGSMSNMSRPTTGPMHMGHAGCGSRRCAGQRAGGSGLRRDARIYVNDAGEPGRYLGAIGAPAVPRGRWARTRRDSGRAVSGDYLVR